MSTYRGNPDKPVETHNDDWFNVDTYVKGLSEFVLTCRTPMTISIQGDWGSGKTSMMNMINETIKEKTIPIWFNTWQFSQFDLGNNLVFSMMSVLLNKLEGDQGNIQKLFSMVKKGVMTYADKKTDNLLSETVFAEESDYAQNVLKIKGQFLDAVNKKLENENKERVVIFIDDLDRLQPGKAVELLEVLKLFLDCENCVFILAVDYEVVTLGIRQKFGDDVSEEKGKSFFDKIIQLPFKMPVAMYDVHTYVRKTLESMSFECPDDTIGLYVDLIRTSIGCNPRSMKRLFNTYQLLEIISKSTVTGVTDLIRRRILFATICMQMHFDELYKYFLTDPNAADNDELKIFTDVDAVDKISERDEDFRRLITGKVKDEHEDLKRIVSFMRYFIKAIQLDDNDDISEDESETLRSILKCSAVTSVGNTIAEGTKSKTEEDYRTANKLLVNKTRDLLADEFGAIERWMPRDAKPEDDIKFSDVRFYKEYETKEGLRFELQFYVIRKDVKTITVWVMLRGTSGNREDFKKTFGDAPFDCYGVKGVDKPWGRRGAIDYPNILVLNADDGDNAQKLADEWRKVYGSLKKYIGK